LIHGLVRLEKKSGFVTALAAVVILVIMATVPSAAQSTRRPRRESTANRKARIARTIDETYGHRWEAAGGGGYMRYRSGPYLRQNNEVSFWVSTLYSLNPKLGILGTVQGSYGNAKIGNTSSIGVWTGDFAPAFTVGANLDYNFDPSFAVRVTPAYLGTTFDSTIQNSKVLNIGFVYRFGKKN